MPSTAEGGHARSQWGRADADRPEGSRRSLRPLVAIGVLVAVMGTGGFVIWDRGGREAGPHNPGKVCPQIVTPTSDRPLTAFGVHRVVLIGDSIMFDPSCAIAESLAKVGIETSRHAIPGSGLLDEPSYWSAEVRTIVATRRPDVVVAIFVGNYLRPIRDPSGATIEPDSPLFFTTWQQRAEALSAQVREAGATMYWVSPPPIDVPPLGGRADRLFDGYRTIEADHLLASGSVLAGRTGRFSGTTVTCGTERGIRTFDGVHLTDDGARIYGQQIAHDLTADLGILTAARPC